MRRRTIVLGFAGAAGSSGVILGTGAFTLVEAERTASVDVAGDGAALLELTPVSSDDEFDPPGEGDGPEDGPPGEPEGEGEPFGEAGNPYVEETNGTIEINLTDGFEEAEGINPNSRTVIRNLVRVTNQGGQAVDTLVLEMVHSSIDLSEIFKFPIDVVNSSEQDEISSGKNILTGENGIPNSLDPGKGIIFGLTIDLRNGGASEALAEDGEYILQIIAEAAD